MRFAISLNKKLRKVGCQHLNEILFFAAILICFLGILIFKKLFGKAGLYGWIAFAIVFANIEVLKSVELFGMQTTLGNVLFGTIFLATDILNECYGYKASKRGVFVGFGAIIAFLMLSQLCLLFKPSATDFAHESMMTLFSLSPRICIASVAMFLLSNLLDVRLFQKIKQVLPGNKWLWVRNNIATIVSQCIENLFFHLIAFYGVYDIYTILELTISVSILEIVIAVLDTPFLYFAKSISSNNATDEAP